MAPSQRQIFRQQAIEHYLQSNSQVVLPKTISPLTFIVGWGVLLLAILAGFLVWLIPVPYYAYAPAIVLHQQPVPHATRHTQLLAFFPATALPLLHTGQSVMVRVEVGRRPNEAQLSGNLNHIAPQSLSSVNIGKRYKLSASQLQTLPSTVVVGTIRLDQQGWLERYDGGSVEVQYQQGSQHVLPYLLQ